MCIICRMREAGMSDEVEELAEELMAAFNTSMLIHQEVLNEGRQHNAKEVAALYGMRDAMAEGGEPEPEQKANMLQELLGKAVRVQVVKVGEGESVVQAIERVAEEIKVEGNGTLH